MGGGERETIRCSRRDQEILEEGGGAGPSHFCPEEIMSREVELG